MSGPDSQIRVLVVDDNEFDRVILGNLLGALGCTVVAVGNAEAAVREVVSGFAVVFMDIVMPDADGYEAARQIRALPAPTGHVPIVALTGQASSADRVRFLTAGMDLWLTKPIIREDLARVLGRFTSWKETTQIVQTAAILDETAVAALFERCAQQEGDFLSDVTLQFRSSSDAALESASRELQAANLENLRFAVEQVRDAAAYVGAAGAMEVAGHILSADQETLTNRGQDWLNALGSEVLRAVVALNARASQPTAAAG